MGGREEIPSVSKTVMVPDPTANGSARKLKKSVSISSSVTSDITDNGDAANIFKPQKSKLRRCRKRLSTLLHTHVALILVCTMAALDASFVIGQIICDILIMKETLSDWETLDKNLTELLQHKIPILNSTAHGQDLNLEKITDILWNYRHSNASALTSQLLHSGLITPGQNIPAQLLNALQQVGIPAAQSAATLNVSVPLAANSSQREMIIGFFKIHHRRKRAVEGVEGVHKLLHDLTHSFHLGSMIILSMLLAETLLKMFAMGRKVLHHKLEVFDAFVVSVSWALDVAFWEGIWAHPGTEAATILIFILPWRVVRIVNSFVLVIQEKDHVQLKIVKQRLRMSVKKSKESVRKASSYRTEVKQLQGLCRKYGANENEIGSCGPTGRSGRRRSSLLPAMERAASLTLISALGSHPSLYTMDSSSDEEGPGSRDLTRTVSEDPTLRSAFSVSTLDSVFTIEGKSNDGYLTSDNEGDNESSAEGLDNPVFVQGDEDSPALPSSPVASSSPQREGDPELGEGNPLARRLHERLVEKSSIVSETSTNSGAGTEPAAQEVPPRYHEVVSKKDSNTRL